MIQFLMRLNPNHHTVRHQNSMQNSCLQVCLYDLQVDFLFTSPELGLDSNWSCIYKNLWLDSDLCIDSIWSLKPETNPKILFYQTLLLHDYWLFYVKQHNDWEKENTCIRFKTNSLQDACSHMLSGHVICSSCSGTN